MKNLILMLIHWGFPASSSSNTTKTGISNIFIRDALATILSPVPLDMLKQNELSILFKAFMSIFLSDSPSTKILWGDKKSFNIFNPNASLRTSSSLKSCSCSILLNEYGCFFEQCNALTFPFYQS